jgi:membrane-associated protease RseP (regulator of RpoE activity)
MRTGFLGSVVVVGLLLAVPGAQQLSVAQGSREPTIDERYRDADSKSRETDLPRLNAPQSKVTGNLPTPAKNSSAAFLGVTFAGNERAAIVRTVAAGSPAEQAGLQPNDLIETLQGRPIRTNQDVLDIVARSRPGDVLDIEFSRRMNIRTQAPLASAPTPALHSVGYPPASTFAAPEDPTMRTNRKSLWQDRNDPSTDQRRIDSQKSNQSDDNRPLLNRLLRRR